MKTDAFLTVTCDRCGCAEDIQLTATAHGWDDRNVDEELEKMNWTTVDDQDFCDKCSDKAENEAIGKGK